MAGHMDSYTTSGLVKPSRFIPTVIIIDEQKKNQSMFGDVLAEMELESRPKFFDFADDALNYLSRNEASLVVMGCNPRSPNGTDQLKRMRDAYDPDALPIMVTTGTHDREFKYRALKFGVSEVLVHPLDLTEFQLRCENLITRQLRGRQMTERADVLQSRMSSLLNDSYLREVDTVSKLHQMATGFPEAYSQRLDRLGQAAQVLALALDVPRSEADAIRHATRLIGIGFLGISEYAVLPDKAPTQKDRAALQDRLQHGYTILRDVQSPYIQLAIDLSYSVGERFDGKGYPLALIGNDIPTAGRIVSALIFLTKNATVASSPKSNTWNAALKALRAERNKTFDPRVVDAAVAISDQLKSILF